MTGRLLELIKFIYQTQLTQNQKDITLFKLQDIMRNCDVYKYLNEPMSASDNKLDG